MRPIEEVVFPYKKLDPFVPLHQQLLDSFLKQYWDFYRQLLQYRQDPSNQEYIRLDHLFDEIFSTVTGYDVLDRRRIEKTRTKKPSMLIVLDHPEIPLHNNPAEFGARKRVRKRAVSFGTRTSPIVSPTPLKCPVWLNSSAKKLNSSIWTPHGAFHKIPLKKIPSHVNLSLWLQSGSTLHRVPHHRLSSPLFIELLPLLPIHSFVNIFITNPQLPLEYLTRGTYRKFIPL